MTDSRNAFQERLARIPDREIAEPFVQAADPAFARRMIFTMLSYPGAVLIGVFSALVAPWIMVQLQFFEPGPEGYFVPGPFDGQAIRAMTFLFGVLLLIMFRSNTFWHWGLMAIGLAGTRYAMLAFLM